MEADSGKGDARRKKWMSVRLNEVEYAELLSRWRQTTCFRMSDYMRKLLFAEPVVRTFRNRSLDDFVEELILLRAELNAIGNNFNQVVRKVNSVKETNSLVIWVKVSHALQQELLEKISLIQKRIDESTSLWLQ